MSSDKLVFAIALFMTVAGLSCRKEIPIPSYIHIDNFTLSTNPSREGSNSQKIVDAWIYVDNQLVGAFEMPCTVPVLASGSHSVTIYPGIKENGISSTRIIYPYYNSYEQTVTLTSGQITNMAPTTTYLQTPSLIFAWIEDFTAKSICDSLNTDTIMHIITPPLSYDSYSGAVYLNSVKNIYLGSSCNQFVLPQGGLPVFLELDYNCNADFNVGVIGYNSLGGVDVQTVALSLRPTTTSTTTPVWNKVYVNLADAISSGTNSVKFSVFFSMLANPNIATSYFYIDNVKLVYSQ